jgi:hypothetical protein
MLIGLTELTASQSPFFSYAAQPSAYTRDSDWLERKDTTRQSLPTIVRLACKASRFRLDCWLLDSSGLKGSFEEKAKKLQLVFPAFSLSTKQLGTASANLKMVEEAELELLV